MFNKAKACLLGEFCRNIFLNWKAVLRTLVGASWIGCYDVTWFLHWLDAIPPCTVHTTSRGCLRGWARYAVDYASASFASPRSASPLELPASRLCSGSSSHASGVVTISKHALINSLTLLLLLEQSLSSHSHPRFGELQTSFSSSWTTKSRRWCYRESSNTPASRADLLTAWK